MYAWGAGLYSLVIMCSDACLNLDLHHLYKRGDLENWARYICQCSSTSSNMIVQCDINLDSSSPQQKITRRVMYCKQWKAGMMAWERDQCDEPPTPLIGILYLLWVLCDVKLQVSFQFFDSRISIVTWVARARILDPSCCVFFQFCTDAAAVSERVVYASEDV